MARPARCESSSCGTCSSHSGRRDGAAAAGGINYRSERGLRHAPRALGPVLRHALQAVYRGHAEPRAQMFDERGHFARGRMAALARRPQRLARERAFAERAAAQFAAPHGLGQHADWRAVRAAVIAAVRHPLPDAPAAARRGGRGAVVVKAALQRRDAALPRAQELLELVEQGAQAPARMRS